MLENTPASHLVDALNRYRTADSVVRECVAAALLGCDTPESYDRLERIALRQGSASFDAHRLDATNQSAGEILSLLQKAGVKIAHFLDGVA